MSTYREQGKSAGRKRHDEYLPIAVAVMLVTTLITIFVLNPEKGGYGGGSDPTTFFESVGLLLGGVLVGYLALVFRSG